MDPYGTYIKSIRYPVKIREGCKYENPPPVEFATADATFRLTDGELVVTFLRDHPTFPDAEKAISPTLRAWEALADLQYSPGEFQFGEPSNHETGMRNPPPPGTIVVGTAHMRQQGARLQITGSVTPPTRRAYPRPPLGFVLTPDAQTMHDRILGSIADREPTQAMAYFCLTVLESNARRHLQVAHIQDTRRKAGVLFKVDYLVLKKVGELTTAYGGRFARKAGTSTELTSEHVYWLRAVVSKLFVRVGEQAAGGQLTPITMADLPPLT